MLDAACSRDDMIAAWREVRRRFAVRRSELWTAYSEATNDLSPKQYAEAEGECWLVLSEGLAGIDAEERALEREFRARLEILDGAPSEDLAV